MYKDRTLVRDHDIKVRVNDAEEEILNSVVDCVGGELAPLVRQMALREARRILADDAKRKAFEQEVAEGGLSCAC